VTDQERYEANLRAAERAHDQAHAQAQQINEAVMRDAQAAIRIVLLINRGAAIAVLAFVGSLASKGGSGTHPAEVISNLNWFVFGVIAAAVSAFSAYLTDYFYVGATAWPAKTWNHPYFQETRSSKWCRALGRVFHLLAVVAAPAGMVFFAIGVWKLQGAMLRLFP
jgi:hypothetical protein